MRSSLPNKYHRPIAQKMQNNVAKKEKPIVRFQNDPIVAPPPKPTLTFRQESNIRNIHRYVPRLHRQQTEHVTDSLLGSSLKLLADSHCSHEEFYSWDRLSANQELMAIIDQVYSSLSRNPFSIQFLDPIQLQGYAHWQAYPEKKVVCFLPIYIPKLRIQPVDPGSVYIRLPSRFHQQTKLKPLDVRHPCADGNFLSCERLFAYFIKHLTRILGVKSIQKERIHTSESQGVVKIDLTENPHWEAELVFCISVNLSSSVYYCHLPFYSLTKLDFTNDFDTASSVFNAHLAYSKEHTPRSIFSEQFSDTSVCISGGNNSENSIEMSSIAGGSYLVDNDKGNEFTPINSKNLPTSTSTSKAEHNESDMTWFACQPTNENKLIRSISATDGGVRLTALLIVFKLFQLDWRLLPFSCYHVQAAMLHQTEHTLDTSPRWQRQSLESCVRLILIKFHYFLCKMQLPHFTISNCDLWFYLSRKELGLAKGALDRIVHSDTALLSLVRRAGRLKD